MLPAHFNLFNAYTFAFYLSLLKCKLLRDRHMTYSLARKHVANEDKILGLGLEKPSSNLISKIH